MPGADELENQPGAEKNKEKNPVVDPPGEDDEVDAGDDELFKDPVKAKALVAKLRTENAKNRIKSKETTTKLTALEQTVGKLKTALGGDENLSPEDQIAKLKSDNEKLIADREVAQTEAEFARIAREYQIPSEHDEYFRFLLAKKVDALEEGEELGEEELESVVKQIRVISGKKGNNKTGVGGDNNPAPDGENEISVEDFSQMNMGEKSALYTKDPALYQRLMKTAKEKRLF